MASFTEGPRTQAQPQKLTDGGSDPEGGAVEVGEVDGTDVTTDPHVVGSLGNGSLALSIAADGAATLTDGDDTTARPQSGVRTQILDSTYRLRDDQDAESPLYDLDVFVTGRVPIGLSGGGVSPQSFTQGTGVQSFSIAGAFTGDVTGYALTSPVAGVSVNAAGTVSVDTGVTGVRSGAIEFRATNELRGSDGIRTVSVTVDVATAGGDTDPPTLVSYVPANNATGVAIDTALNMTFHEPVYPGTGAIQLWNETDNVLLEEFVMPQDTGNAPGDVQFATEAPGSPTMQIHPSVDLPHGKTISRRIAPGAVVDAAGNPFAGIADGSVSFSTVAQNQPPVAWSNTAGTPLRLTESSQRVIDLVNGTRSPPSGQPNRAYDPDGGSLSVAGTPTALHGTIDLVDGVDLHYTPPARATSQTDQISYTVQDSGGATAQGTVHVDVVAAIAYAPTFFDTDGTKRVDSAEAFHTVDSTEFTLFFSGAIANDQGSKMVFRLATDLWFNGVGATYRPEIRTGVSGPTFNNGHLRPAGTIMHALYTGRDNGDGTQTFEYWLDQTGGEDFILMNTKTVAAVPLGLNGPFSLLCNPGGGTTGSFVGRVNHLAVWPVGINPAASPSILRAFTTAGGQLQPPATAHTAMGGAPIRGGFYSAADFAALPGAVNF